MSKIFINYLNSHTENPQILFVAVYVHFSRNRVHIIRFQRASVTHEKVRIIDVDAK